MERAKEKIIPFVISTISLIALTFGIPNQAQAWFFGNVGFEETWTDNIFLVSDRQSDWISRPFIEMNFGPFAGVIPYYTGSGYLYSENPDLDAYIHEGGLEFKYPFGQDRQEFHLAGYYRGSLHAADSNELDFHEGGARLGFKFRPYPSFMIGPNVSGSYRTFPNAGDLSFVETSAWLVLNKSFKSKTTLRISGRFDYKRFLNDIESETTSESQSESETQTSSLSTGEFRMPMDGQYEMSANGSAENGKQQDSAGKNDSGSGSSEGSGRDGVAGGGIGEVANTQTVEVAQLLTVLRLAQGFGNRVGSYIEGTYRLNLLDPPRYVEGAVPTVDREVFDDHYGYEGPGGAANVSILLPEGFRINVHGMAEMRSYEGRDALDENFEPLNPSEDRLDVHALASLRFEYSRFFDLLFPASITASIAYGHVWNRSNDEYFDADENWISAMVSLGW